MTATKASSELCEESFRPLLTNFDDTLLDSRVVCTYGLWPDLTIAYLSPGWFGFAAANGGEPEISQRWNLGSNLLTGIQGPLRSFFRDGYLRCLKEQRYWEHSYQCSSMRHYRWLQMLAYPLKNSEGLLVTHTLRIERSHRADLQSSLSNPKYYTDQNNLMQQCSYCRRMRRAARPDVWDWVGSWVEKSPENTSHGICESCYGYYMSRLEDGLDFPKAIKTFCE